MLIDAAQQGSAFGVQQFQPGVLAPQLLGFALDLLHPLHGFALVLPRALLDLLDLELDPSSTNRARLRAFLTLMAQRPLEDNDGGP